MTFRSQVTSILQQTDRQTDG